MPRYLSACTIAALAATTALAGEHPYRYDTVHSQIVFSIDHDGYSRPFGRLHIARGALLFDDADWSRSHTELDIDMAGVDMGDARWNQAACKPDLLACDRFPTAHFASTSVERKSEDEGVLHGTLGLRGITLPLDVTFRLNRRARTLYGLHTVAGFSGTARLLREAFGMRAFAGSIGHDVSVWLEIEAIASGDDRPSQQEHR